MFQEVRKIAILNTVSWKSANRKGDIKGGENGSQRCPGGRALQVNPDRAGCLGLYEETGRQCGVSPKRAPHPIRMEKPLQGLWIFCKKGS